VCEQLAQGHYVECSSQDSNPPKNLTNIYPQIFDYCWQQTNKQINNYIVGTQGVQTLPKINEIPSGLHFTGTFYVQIKLMTSNVGTFKLWNRLVHEIKQFSFLLLYQSK